MNISSVQFLKYLTRIRSLVYSKKQTASSKCRSRFVFSGIRKPSGHIRFAFLFRLPILYRISMLNSGGLRVQFIIHYLQIVLATRSRIMQNSRLLCILIFPFLHFQREHAAIFFFYLRVELLN